MDWISLAMAWIKVGLHGLSACGCAICNLFIYVFAYYLAQIKYGLLLILLICIFLFSINIHLHRIIY